MWRRTRRSSSSRSITKPDKGNGVVILDRKLYDNAIQEIISDTSKFEKLNEDPTLKQKVFLTKMNMISCILLVLLLLESMVLRKWTSSPVVIHFLNFV